MESVAHYKEILLVLGTAGIIVPLLMRWGVNSILGYLIVGIILGPDMMGALAERIPSLSPIAFSRGADFSSLAELGVVFLLFLIGLELSLERLNTMKRLVFGMGGLQVVVSIALIGTAAFAMGYSTKQAALLGMALSLSSTAIVIQLLSESKRLGSQSGRVSFAILLMQDLAVIPILMLVAFISTDAQGNLATHVVQALIQALAAVLMIILVGRYALRPTLKMVAKTQSTDLFMAAVLFIAVGTGALANLMGLSMSLGAFIAGLMLAETEYRRAIEAIIEPFKGIFLGAFFLVVGLGLNLEALAEAPMKILAIAFVLVAIKSAIIFSLGRLFKVSSPVALETALLLGPCGEFAFVILAASSAAAKDDATPLLIVTLTMMMIPFFARIATWMRPKMVRNAVPSAAAIPPLQELSSHVVIAGYGRVGSLVASMLAEHKISFIAVDGDPALVERERKSGAPVYFGDASNQVILEKCGVHKAKALAITMDNPAKVEEIVKLARAAWPDLKIIARSRDERHAMQLYARGVTEAVPETVESSLQLGEALLVEVGVPMGLAIASIHERRDAFRKLLGRPNRREQLKSAREKLRKRFP